MMVELAGKDNKTRRDRGLKRPKTTLSFQHGVPMLPSDTESHAITSLSKQVHLLTLLIRRNKNQHRSQLFFKHVRLLRHSLLRLLGIHTDLANLTSTTTTGSSTTADSVRRRFEAEASLRAQCDVWEEHIREVVVPKCYAAFASVVVDTQFANLGVVLVGVLADVAGVIGGPSVKEVTQDESEILETEMDLQIPSRGRQAVTVEGTSTKATGEDWGEVIERVYEATDSEGGLGEVSDSVARHGQVRADAGTKTHDDPELQTQKVGAVTQEPASSNTDVGDNAPSKSISKGTGLPEVQHSDNSDRPRKKKKKGKSAIDDLFKGLL